MKDQNSAAAGREPVPLCVSGDSPILVSLEALGGAEPETAVASLINFPRIIAGERTLGRESGKFLVLKSK